MYALSYPRLVYHPKWEHQVIAQRDDVIPREEVCFSMDDVGFQ